MNWSDWVLASKQRARRKKEQFQYEGRAPIRGEALAVLLSWACALVRPTDGMEEITVPAHSSRPAMDSHIGRLVELAGGPMPLRVGTIIVTLQ